MESLFVGIQRVFPTVLSMSLSAGILVLLVVLLRFALRRAPKWIVCLLWLLVAVRLLCPVLPESRASLMPQGEMRIASEAQLRYAMDSGLPEIEFETPRDHAVNQAAAESGQNGRIGTSASPSQYLPFIWAAGVLAMLLYALISFLRLRRRVSASVRYEGSAMICDEIESPFILGVLRPRIYLPFGLSGAQLSHVLAHERAHLRRRDHLWKPLGFLLLAVYWFNPLLWLAYVLLCRDIELACDERVVRDMDAEDRADYSQTLLDCGRARRVITACPLAFGEVGVRARIKAALNYKKPAFWIVVAAIVVCAAAAVCFLTNPDVSFKIDRSEVERVTYFNMFVGDDCQGEFNQNQIDEMVDRFSAVSKAGRSDRYEGMTPGYQLCVFLKDGSFIYANGYNATDDMVEIVYNDKRYAVSDPEFAEYLRDVCSANDAAPARSEETDTEEGETVTELDALRSKYPEFFDLPTAKGLEVYVERGPRDYYCVLKPGTNREKTGTEIWGGKAASVSEMRAILSTYDIPEDNIFIIPSRNPLSSYWYEINDEYAEMLRKMFFDNEAFGHVSVAYVNYSDESRLLSTCLNRDLMWQSSIQHLPIFRFDTKVELDSFRAEFGDVLTLDQGYDEMPSFNDVAGRYDDGFFAENTLLLAYAPSGSGSYRYGLYDLYCDGSSFCMYVTQTNDPETHTDDMAGWAVMVEMPDSEVAGCTDFDAQMGRPME